MFCVRASAAIFQSVYRRVCHGPAVPPAAYNGGVLPSPTTQYVSAFRCASAFRPVACGIVLAAASALAMPGPVHGQEPPQASRCFSVPRSSLDFEAADLDGDGLTDLALFETETGRVRVLGNRAAGGFEPVDDLRVSVPFELPPGHATIRSVDVDADGFLDLVAGGFALQFLAVAFGQGDGSFADFAEFPLTVPGHARGFVAGDFDADGLPELVIVGPAGGDVLVLEGRRDRKLDGPRPVRTSVTYPHFLAAGDFNADGHADIAVWGRNEPGPFLSILEGDGGGGFREVPVTSPLLDPREGPIGPRSGVVADLGGDGALELVLVAAPPNGQAWRVQQDGVGSYSVQDLGVAIGPGSGVPSITAGDWNADGREDLVLLAADGWSVSLFANTGRPQPPFEASCRVGLPGQAAVLAAGELDGLAGGDLVLEHSLERRIQVLHGPFGHCGGVISCTGGDAGACYKPIEPHAAQNPERVLIADLDVDGRAEVIAAGDGGALVLASGPGGLVERASLPFPAAAEGLDAADVDGDGILDLAVADFASGMVEVFLLDPGLKPRVLRLSAGILPADVLLKDLDGDGIVDLAVALLGEGGVKVFRGRGRGEFAERTIQGAGPRPHSLGAGDMDGDGLDDFALANELTGISVLLGRGGGAFAEPATVRSPSDPGAIAVADLEADGVSEVIATSRIAPAITIVIQQGGTFRWRTLELPVGTRATGVRHADLDGDGVGDLVAADSGSRRILILSGKEPGQFAATPEVLLMPPVPPAGGTKALALAAADLDGDGFLDLVVGDGGLNQVNWFRSRGCGRSSPFRRGDVDGDGRTLISDAVGTLHALFAGAGPLACADAADTDDDGKVVLTDAVALLLFLFQGGAAPALPFSACAQDPTEDRLGSCEGRGEGGCSG